MYKIKITKEAAKFYKKCDVKTKRQINECFNILKENPNNHVNIKRLHGELSGLLRYRIGSIRIIFSINEEEVTVIILSIGNRGDVYK